MNHTLDDQTIINQLHNNDDSNLEVLIARHSGICNNMISSIAPSGHLSSEIHEDAGRFVYEAAKNFDPDRGAKFSTYLGNYSRWQAQDVLSEFGKSVPTDMDVLNYKIDENLEPNKEKTSLEENLEMVVDILDQVKEPRMKKVVKMRFFNKENIVMSYNQIADKLGISHETARTWCNKFIILAREKMKSQSLVDNI